ncbi:carboxymuconolactone decarboxylase family protein [Aliikangiella maris]|uniref:Carboxymuconolactone decarboxylase family protein n=2 Tax=Aliikangiella maris TaxID=3162458 RepID=A0ABV3MQF0_9GAMM
MSNRVDFIQLVPEAMTILMTQEDYLQHQFASSESLSVGIVELVKLRVSQINQCAYCIDMHSKDALKNGETYERMLGLSAWKDMPLFSEQERNALWWAELVTLEKVIDEVDYQRVIDCFGELATVNLTIAINAINSWNKMVKVFKPQVGYYHPASS